MIVDLDAPAAALGAAVVLAAGVPVAVVGSLVLDDGSDAVFALALVVLVAVGAGGWYAASRATRSPLVTAAAAALAGFALLQAFSVALQVVGDDDVNPAAVAFNAVVAVGVGLLGGWLATRRTTP